jgi:hypothetical protein
MVRRRLREYCGGLLAETLEYLFWEVSSARQYQA